MPAPAPLSTPATMGAASVTTAEPNSDPGLTAERTRVRSLSRFTVRDYTYVRRELMRIVIIAIAMLVVIVVLSFFLP